MIHSFHFNGSAVRQSVPREEWKGILDSRLGLLWLDLDAPTEDEIDILTEIFDFHTLSIEDCILPNHCPKLDDYDRYLFIIFHALSLRQPVRDADSLEILELNIFVGPNYLVTFHDDPIPIMNQLRARCSAQHSLLGKGPDFLLHLLMDNVVDEMTRILDRIEDRLDAIEDKILADEEGALVEINEFKGLISKFRKIAGPHRDIVRMLMSQTFSFIDSHQAIYFKDIHDHLIAINETATMLREVIASTLDTYLSMVSKKLNVVMKFLTIFTVIFMPLNLIAGIGGMSEFTMMADPASWANPWPWLIPYALMILFMTILGVGTFYLLRRSKLA
jgi:magnesium transporter